MQCLNPYWKHFLNHSYASPLPCGHCAACRYNQASDWSFRIKCEAKKYEKFAFLTLTYDDLHCPSDYSLRPYELTNFIKRLRKHVSFRYFACGEYGSLRGRPHYHLLLFGVSAQDISSFVGISKQDYLKGVRPRVVGNGYNVCWTSGFVDVQTPLSPDNCANYVASYVAKKQKASDYARICPPFHRCSQGLGKNIIDLLPFFTRIIKEGEFIRVLPRYIKLKLAEKFNCVEQMTKESLEMMDFNMTLIVSSFSDKMKRYRDWLQVPKNLRPDYFLEKSAYLSYYSSSFSNFLAKQKIRDVNFSRSDL